MCRISAQIRKERMIVSISRGDSSVVDRLKHQQWGLSGKFGTPTGNSNGTASTSENNNNSSSSSQVTIEMGTISASETRSPIPIPHNREVQTSACIDRVGDNGGHCAGAEIGDELSL